MQCQHAQKRRVPVHGRPAHLLRRRAAAGGEGRRAQRRVDLDRLPQAVQGLLRLLLLLLAPGHAAGAVVGAVVVPTRGGGGGGGGGCLQCSKCPHQSVADPAPSIPCDCHGAGSGWTGRKHSLFRASGHGNLLVRVGGSPAPVHRSSAPGAVGKLAGPMPASRLAATTLRDVPRYSQKAVLDSRIDDTDKLL